MSALLANCEVTDFFEPLELIATPSVAKRLSRLVMR
jgi:hypothetical protein